jgi:hypothetical protein
VSWTSPYIVVRVEEGIARVIHEAKLIKDARYYLQYIAMPGDALFQTSAHPKYVGDGSPLYQAHLIARGNIDHEEQNWLSKLPTATKPSFASP